MLKLTLDLGRSELPNQIIFKETPKVKCGTSIDLNFKIDIKLRQYLRKEIIKFCEKFPQAESYTSRSLFLRGYEDSILKNTPFLCNASIMERVYFLASDLNIIDIVCPICGNKKRFIRPRIGYSNGCCSRHANSVMSNALAPVVGPKISDTHRKRTPEQNTEISKRAQETFKKNHPNITRSDIARQTFINHPDSYKKIAEKHRQWVKNNPDKVKEASLKAAKTMKEKIDGNGNNHYTRLHLKKLEKDENGLNFYQRQHLKALEKDENGFNQYERSRIKMEEAGKWIKISELPDYKQYRWWCWYYTRQNDLTILKNHEKRGKHYAGEDKDVYSLDHIYSIAQGFKNNILPCIIGSIHNLRFIRWNENLAKKDRCDITIEELVEKIQNNK